MTIPLGFWSRFRLYFLFETFVTETGLGESLHSCSPIDGVYKSRFSRVGTITEDHSLAESLQIVHHPHPTLRHKSKPVQRVDGELVRVVRRMFDLMYEAKGIGLAANQVDLPLRLFVVNLAAQKGEGEEMVFINPVLSKPKGHEKMEEGCLSLPGVYGDVARPKQITVHSFNLRGEEIKTELDGMMSRVVQHETDHLDGRMFTDRLTETGKLSVRGLMEEFEVDFESKQNTGEIPVDSALNSRRAELETRYC